MMMMMMIMIMTTTTCQVRLHEPVLDEEAIVAHLRCVAAVDTFQLQDLKHPPMTMLWRSTEKVTKEQTSLASDPI